MAEGSDWMNRREIDTARIELSDHRRRLEGEHGPLLGTRFDRERERFEEFYADGTTFARKLSATLAELAFETH